MPKISELPAAASAAPDAALAVSQNGTTQRVTRAQLVEGLKSDAVSASGQLLGRVSQGPGPIEEIALGQGLELAGGTLRSAGLKADAVSAPNLLLGRAGPGAGPIQEIGLGQGLALRNGMLAATGTGPLQVVSGIDPGSLDDSANGAQNGAFAPGSTWLNAGTGSMFACLDATPGAAVWERINDFVGLRSDRWYTGPYAQIASAPGQLVWNAHLVRFARRCTIASVAIRVTTAGSAAARVAIAIYANANGIPGAKLCDFPTIVSGLDTIGVKQPVGVVPFTIANPGWYWMVTQADAQGPVMPALQCTNATPQLNNEVGDGLVANVLGTVTTHGVLVSPSPLGTFGLPAMAPAVTNQARVPLVAFSVAS